MKLKALKQIEIEIKDNDHCSTSCPFLGSRAVDFCVLYGEKEIECVSADFKRLQECKDQFGVIGLNGWVYGKNRVNTNPGGLYHEDR
jgi:hypothetical protein